MFKKSYSIGIIFVGAILLFLIGYNVGQVSRVQTALTNDSGEVEIEKVRNLYSKKRGTSIDFDQYWDVWDTLHEEYVDIEIDDVALLHKSIEGLVSGLNDPYSVYMPPTEAEAFITSFSGEFEGIGAALGTKDNLLVIIEPLQDSPAERAGLLPGDAIYKIDGEDAVGIEIEDAVLKIRGEKGSTVTLSIAHDGSEEVVDISVVRDTIVVPTVLLEMDTETQIAYIRINQFNQDTWQEFNDIVTEITDGDLSGIVLDLRSNPGGLLDSSIKVASEWIPEGVIVREKERGEVDSAFGTNGFHRLAGIPTAVLVNEGTASGSEIVAGALQDYKAAIIMGMQTFGKGSVQDFEVLPGGAALKLTIAEWLTPLGRHINTIGITPDIIIDEMFDTETETIIDLGRQQAVEYLTNN